MLFTVAEQYCSVLKGVYTMPNTGITQGRYRRYKDDTFFNAEQLRNDCGAMGINWGAMGNDCGAIKMLSVLFHLKQSVQDDTRLKIMRSSYTGTIKTLYINY
jgi:hypothetical protein